MKILICSLLIFHFANLTAQNFEPNNGIFEIYDYRFEYYSKIRNKLFKNLSDKPEVRMVVVPSFSPEYIFQIEKNKNGGYWAKLNIANESIWYNEDYQSITINEFVAEISKEDVDLLSKVYLKSIEKVHYPIKESLGLDGVTYNLSAWDYGLKSGTIWSPSDFNNKTIIGISQKLTDDLKKNKKKLAIGENDRKLLAKIFNELNNLPQLENYELCSNVKRAIDTYKIEYISKLAESHKPHFEKLLADFERKMLLQLTFNNVDNDYMLSLINNYQKRFEDYIKFETYSDDTDNIEDYINRNKSDNIFLKLKTVLNE